eukprot:jgi/Tetstr1/454073/TSEL_040992.t1
MRRPLPEDSPAEPAGRLSPAELGRAHIATPRPLPYTRTGSMDVWDVLRLADAGEDERTVRLLYSGYEIDPGERDTEYVSGWTREHVWPKSRGGTAGGRAAMTTAVAGMGTDAHNLFAADQSVNSTRSNKHFACLPDGEAVVDRSPPAGYDGVLLAKTCPDAWEPPDAAKGPVARALMYMACAYPDSLRLVDTRSDTPGELGILSDVLRWHREFPPCARERRRNDVVERAQGNRNPFVDSPRLADSVVWGAA